MSFSFNPDTNQLRSFSSVFDQLSYAVRNSCTFANPVVNAVQVQTQLLFLTLCNWVEETYFLDEATVASLAAVCNNDLLEWSLFSAVTCQPKGYQIVLFAVLN
jgi:hypothetical protein